MGFVLWLDFVFGAKIAVVITLVHTGESSLTLDDELLDIFLIFIIVRQCGRLEPLNLFVFEDSFNIFLHLGLLVVRRIVFDLLRYVFLEVAVLPIIIIFIFKIFS